MRKFTLGLFKAAECGFYAMDPLSIGVRQFLATANTPEVKETNPKLEIKLDVFRAPKTPFLRLTLLNDQIFYFEGKEVHLGRMMEKMEYTSFELLEKEIISDVEKQLLKDIDNEIK